MQRDSDEDAWRAIVENYGDRVELDDDLFREPVAPPDESDLAGLAPLALDPAVEPEEDRFIPPPPPPLPRLPADRLLAWTGLFGSPTLLLVFVVFGFGMPPWVAYLLIASFIGGFVYLVVKMPRGPADPWDDGARL